MMGVKMGLILSFVERLKVLQIYQLSLVVDLVIVVIKEIKDYNLSGVSIASAFHYNKISPQILKIKSKKLD